MSNYLNDILQSKQITKTDLAKEIGLDRTTISKMCSDKEYAKRMKIETAHKICKVLDISLEEFIEDICNIDDTTNSKLNIIIDKFDELIKIVNEIKGGKENGRKEN